MAIAQGDRHRPFDTVAIPNVLIGLPRNFRRRIAEPENRVEQQIDGAGPSADNQLSFRYGVFKSEKNL